MCLFFKQLKTCLAVASRPAVAGGRKGGSPWPHVGPGKYFVLQISCKLASACLWQLQAGLSVSLATGGRKGGSPWPHVGPGKYFVLQVSLLDVNRKCCRLASACLWQLQAGLIWLWRLAWEDPHRSAKFRRMHLYFSVSNQIHMLSFVLQGGISLLDVNQKCCKLASACLWQLQAGLSVSLATGDWRGRIPIAVPSSGECIYFSVSKSTC